MANERNEGQAMNEELKKALDDLGAIAEISVAFYRAAIGAGADEKEAAILTRTYLEASFTDGRRQKREQEEMEE